jgi:hypothetical protein
MGVVAQGDFFFEKIYPGLKNAGAKFIQVFEKPNTGGTMNLWQKKAQSLLGFVAIIKEAIADVLVVEPSIFASVGVALEGDTGMLRKIIVGTHPVVGQDLVHSFAAFATKGFFFEVNVIIGANIAAMIAMKDRYGQIGAHAIG